MAIGKVKVKCIVMKRVASSLVGYLFAVILVDLI
jgi:hypothetical protein